MLSGNYCPKCNKNLTIREVASHNAIPGISRYVCFPCFQGYLQDKDPYHYKTEEEKLAAEKHKQLFRKGQNV